MSNDRSEASKEVHFISQGVRQWEVKNKAPFQIEVIKDGKITGRIPVQWLFIRELERRVSGGYKYTWINGRRYKRTEVISILQKVYAELIFKKSALEGIGDDEEKW